MGREVAGSWTGAMAATSEFGKSWGGAVPSIFVDQCHLYGKKIDVFPRELLSVLECVLNNIAKTPWGWAR